MPRYKKLKMVSPNTICTGDSLKVLKRVADNSIDLICSDPPYGIKFMGKKWDKAVPSVDIWRECLRVLKPGAFAFIMCSPRQDCLARMLMNLEEAGFVMKFTSIYWTHATGFPKSGNVSKLIDKRLGAERKIVGENPTWREAKRDNKVYQTVDGGSAKYITESSSPQAIALEGSYVGFQPKPAVEVIIVAMKPLSEKTYIDQVIKNGKGVSWFDDCRIPTGENLDGGAYSKGGRMSGLPSDTRSRKAAGMFAEGEGRLPGQYKQPTGRFPANLLVSDDALNDGTVTRSPAPYIQIGADKHSAVFGENWSKRNGKVSKHHGDSGSYSRYFDLDAWWAERISDLPEGAQKTFPYLAVAKPGKSEKTHKGTIENKHPTVKPLKLMSYLVTLGSRPGDIVLDPFCGSGTTCVAAKTLKRKYIGIDQDKQWVEVSRKRLDTVS